MAAAPAQPDQPAPAAAPPPGQPPAAGGSRLAWLDALRGIAALSVVFDHLGYHVLQGARHAVYQWLDTGQYGVFVFFLVSGYIVPASLERKGSVRGFWVSRAFRLYPLYLAALAGAWVLAQFGLGSLHGMARHPVTAVLTHLFMISNVLGGPNGINVLWTLSYEMVFYLLLTAAFVTGTHRRSGLWALGLAVAAVVLGGLLPAVLLGPAQQHQRLLAAAADLLIGGGLALAVARGRIPRVAGAVLAAVTGLALAAGNGAWLRPWEALTILALMFTGTLLYRAGTGQVRPWLAGAAAVTVIALAVAAGLWHGPPGPVPAAGRLQWQREWVSSLVLAGLTFAIGLACRKRRVPAALAWLGLVSYSVYLLHPVLLGIYTALPVTSGAHSLPVQVLLAAGFLAVLLMLCALTYRLVEAPMQGQGRKVAAWLESRYGPDRWPDLARPAPGRTPAGWPAGSRR